MMTVLADARRVAAHHGHHSSDAATGDGVDQRPVSGAEPPAEIVRQVLVGEAAGPQGKVEVMEVFSYGCPACNHFVPVMRKLKQSLPANAVVNFLPAGFNA